MSASKILRLPFIVTVAAAAAACGGTTVVEGGSGGAGGSNGNGGASSSVATGTAASNVASATTGGGGNCPAEAPNSYQQCESGSGPCNYDVTCQSGTVSLQFSCNNDFGYWELVPTACNEPYDSCAGTQYYCDESWWMPEGTNPPAPCPDSLPQNGAECMPFSMGGIHPHCGYRCSDVPGSPWVIATCEQKTPNGPVWLHDEACAP